MFNLYFSIIYIHIYTYYFNYIFICLYNIDIYILYIYDVCVLFYLTKSSTRSARQTWLCWTRSSARNGLCPPHWLRRPSASVGNATEISMEEMIHTYVIIYIYVHTYIFYTYVQTHILCILRRYQIEYYAVFRDRRFCGWNLVCRWEYSICLRWVAKCWFRVYIYIRNRWYFELINYGNISPNLHDFKLNLFYLLDPCIYI